MAQYRTGRDAQPETAYTCISPHPLTPMQNEPRGDDLSTAAGDALRDIKHSAERAATDVKERVEGAAGATRERVQEGLEAVKSKAEGAAGAVKERTLEAVGAVEDAAGGARDRVGQVSVCPRLPACCLLTWCLPWGSAMLVCSCAYAGGPAAPSPDSPVPPPFPAGCWRHQSPRGGGPGQCQGAR